MPRLAGALRTLTVAGPGLLAAALLALLPAGAGADDDGAGSWLQRLSEPALAPSPQALGARLGAFGPGAPPEAELRLRRAALSWLAQRAEGDASAVDALRALAESGPDALPYAALHTLGTLVPASPEARAALLGLALEPSGPRAQPALRALLATPARTAATLPDLLAARAHLSPAARETVLHALGDAPALLPLALPATPGPDLAALLALVEGLWPRTPAEARAQAGATLAAWLLDAPPAAAGRGGDVERLVAVLGRLEGAGAGADPRLIEALGDPVEPRASRAAQALARRDDLRPVFAARMSDPRPERRRGALRLVAAAGGPASREERSGLALALGDADGRVRAFAALALVVAWRPDERATAPEVERAALARGLSDLTWEEAPERRRAAARPLALLGLPAADACAGLARLLADPERAVRRAALAALAGAQDEHLGGLAEALVRCLTQPSAAEDRPAVLRLLGRAGPAGARAEPALIGLAGQADPAVARAALDVLGRLPALSAEGLLALGERLPGLPPGTARHALPALSALGDRALPVLPWLLTAARGPEEGLRPAATLRDGRRLAVEARVLLARLGASSAAVREAVRVAADAPEPAAASARALVSSFAASEPAWAEVLCALLASAHAEAAADARQALLGHAAGPRAWPDLAVRLGRLAAGEAEHPRRRAAEVLGRMGRAGAAALPLLLQRLAASDAEPEIQAAVLALGPWEPTAALEALPAWPRERREALVPVLTALPGPALVEPRAREGLSGLDGWLADPTLGLEARRRLLVGLLFRLDPLPARLRSAVERCLGDDDPALAALAARRIAAEPDGTAWLAAQVPGAQPGVLRAILSERLGTGAAGPLEPERVEPLLRHADPELRWLAAQTLLRQPGAVPRPVGTLPERVQRELGRVALARLSGGPSGDARSALALLGGLSVPATAAVHGVLRWAGRLPEGARADDALVADASFALLQQCRLAPVPELLPLEPAPGAASALEQELALLARADRPDGLADALPGLVGLLASPSAALRRGAVAALGRRGPAAAAARGALERLGAEQPGDPLVRWAIQALSPR